jgi:hypothetical protein
VWVSREIVLGYKGVGGGERKGRDVDVSSICGYRFFEFLDKLDGIVDEESKCAILVLKILVAILVFVRRCTLTLICSSKIFNVEKATESTNFCRLMTSSH